MTDWVKALSKQKKERADGGHDEEIVDSIPLHEVTAAEVVGGNFFADPMDTRDQNRNSGQGTSRRALRRATVIGSDKSSSHGGLGYANSSSVVNGFSPEAALNFTLPLGQHSFCIRTVPNGFNSGRVFVFRSASERENESWIQAIGDGSRAASAEHMLRHRVSLVQEAGQDFMQSGPVQLFLSSAILASFVTIIVETQLQPVEGEAAFAYFAIIDTVYLIVFTLELAMNMFCYWWRPFWADGWLRFDLVVVILSLVQAALESLVTSQVPGIKQLRVLRTFRIIKAFGRFKELKKIIRAICASVGPVGHATVITGKC